MKKTAKRVRDEEKLRLKLIAEPGAWQEILHAWRPGDTWGWREGLAFAAMEEDQERLASGGSD
ncbi:MAG: hypothetical protein ACYDHP_12825 [Ferrimicrobium sp.]